MFLWVRVVLAELECVDTDEDFKTTLGNLPSTMNGVYQKALARVCLQFKDVELLRLKEIFTWLVASKRYLTLNELDCGILVSRKMGPRTGKTKIAEVLQKCGSIIVKRKEGQEETLAFVHDTFNQFITDEEGWAAKASSKARKLFVNRTDAECRLAMACMEYICQETIE